MTDETGAGKTYTVRLETGETFGPAPMTTIVQWAREGRIPHTAMFMTGDDQPPLPV